MVSNVYKQIITEVRFAHVRVRSEPASVVMSTIARECMASARRSSFVSQYVGTLPDKDRLLYLEKLVLTSGEEIPDPYSIGEADWIVDIREWPIISWPDIHGYLIDTPSLYTKEKLRAYKSLDAVNYVLCGHVQEIKYHGISPESDFCLLRSLVLPSQRQGSSSTLYDACRHGYASASHKALY
jgi:hypothetical protein